MLSSWRRYLDGTPEYLARHYWWAYLSPAGVWFFSHHSIINLILFGQYRALLAALTAHLGATPCGRMLQLTCAYGELTPALAGLAQELHLNDAAAIQLRLASRTLSTQGRTALITRMNAEALGYATDCFDTVVVFFLLHELPATAREHALDEAMRVLKPSGRLLIAEYGPHRNRHPLHRLPPFCRILERLEPFLHDFWHSDLHAQLQASATQHNKQLHLTGETTVFGGFYRVVEYRIERKDVVSIVTSMS